MLEKSLVYKLLIPIFVANNAAQVANYRMRNTIITLTFLLIFTIFGFQCTLFEKTEKWHSWERPLLLDLDEITARGYLRAVVDNSSTGYYIYRGRRMGYEFEMLKSLASSLNVRLHLIVKSDIHEAFDLLNRGKADIVAMNLEINEERRQFVAFSKPLGTMGTVLVQKEGTQPVESPLDLQDKTIHIQRGAVYKAQLCSLMNSMGVDFAVIEEKGNGDTFVEKVLKGEIEYSVVDRVVALVNASHHSDLRVGMELSPKADVAWAIRKNSPQLEKALNDWIGKKEKSGYIRTMYAKYFQNSNNQYYRNNSQYSSLAGNRISPYDELIKANADNLGWDWRLLASLVYKESGFDSAATSVAGATGLLQLMPVTLERFGVDNPNDPIQSMAGGVNFLKYLDRFWRQRVPDTNERLKFVLASYNIGHGHVEDAWKLTLKYGKNPQDWKEVAGFLRLKSDPKYFNDPVVKSGFAKGNVAVNYVQDILLLYDSYRTLVTP